jgi:serine/threonine protein phosphatase 1
MECVKHFDKNMGGRDFVAGDVHGCFTLLQTELNNLNFDPVVDRLFFVGDLVDRGPESEEFWDYLRQPWAHSIRGNHEDLVINSVRKGNESHESAVHYMNGGEWLYGLPIVEQQCYACVLEELPLAIEIDTDNGLVGIIHAECPLGDWNLFKSMYECNKDRFEAVAMWARTKIEHKDDSVIVGLHKLYVGHTPCSEVVVLGNVEYIDQGACFRGGKLTIKQIN